MMTLRAPHRSFAWRLLALAFVTVLCVPAPADAKDDASPLVIADGKTIEVRKGGKLRQLVGHSFGILAQRTETMVALPYRNTGTETLRGIRVSSGCGCFGATVSARELAPGASGTLTIRFRSGAIKGEIDKPLRLLFLAGKTKGSTTFTIHARVIAGILVERVFFDQVRSGSKPTASVPLAWFHEVGKPFKINKIEVTGPKISTRIEPYQAGDGSTYRGYRIHFTFQEAPPKGIYSRKAVVHTDHPDHPTVLIPMHASVVGAVWVQTSRVYLGLVPEGQARSASVRIKLTGKEPPPIGAVNVTSRTGKLKISVKDEFLPPPMGPHKVITITLPADSAVGAIDDMLEVRAEQAGDDVTEIQVVGRVYTPQGPK